MGIHKWMYPGFYQRMYQYIVSSCCINGEKYIYNKNVLLLYPDSYPFFSDSKGKTPIYKNKNIKSNNDNIIKLNNHIVINNFNRDICYKIGKFLTYEDKVKFIKVAKFIKINMQIYKNIYPVREQEFIEAMKQYSKQIINNLILNCLNQINSSPCVFIKVLIKRILSKMIPVPNVKEFMYKLCEGKTFYKKCIKCLRYHKTNLLYDFDIVQPSDILEPKLNKTEVDKYYEINHTEIIKNQISKTYRSRRHDKLYVNYHDTNQYKKVKIMNQNIPMNIKFKRNYR
jgi:hypothetical protein